MSVQPVRVAGRPTTGSPGPAEIPLQPPPLLPRPSSGSFMQGGGGQMLFMIPMMLGMGAMSFSTMASRGGPMLVVYGVLYGTVLVGMVAFAVMGRSSASKAQLNDERRDYLRWLDQTRDQVRELAEVQRRALLDRHPAPSDLADVARGARRWDRRRRDASFVQVRMGVGPQRLACDLRMPDTAPLEDLDPVSATALRQLLRTYSVLDDLPVALSLASFPRVAVHGDRAAALGLVRSLLAQLVTFHSPQDVRVALCVSPQASPVWEWTKWLPHLLHPTDMDELGPVRQAAPGLSQLAAVLGDQLGTRPRFVPPPDQQGTPGAAGPHLVVVVDGGDTTGEGVLGDETGLAGVTVIDLAGDGCQVGPYGMRLVVEPDRVGTSTPRGVALVGRPDHLGVPAAEALARSMTRAHAVRERRREVREEPEQHLAGDMGLPDLLGIDDLTRFDVAAAWRARPARSRLRIPFGVDASGEPVELDLKESAEGGMGPHGLLVGATGAGKSELLRTLVLGIAATHSTDSVNFVLVDFKGGATFAGLGSLPHTAAVITNLADDKTLVDRMRDALNGELVRRQEVLRDAGNHASVRDYERARAAGADLPPLPSLLVIIDEFSELLTAQPEFIDLFVTIGRLGRSLGVHLLLASQRLDEGRLRGLDSHLSYRIGLRTFSASESRSVLGVTDAATLPPVPGSGFLRVDTSTLLRFKAAYVSGPAPVHVPRLPVPRTTGRAGPAAPVGPVTVGRFTLGAGRPLRHPDPEPGTTPDDVVPDDVVPDDVARDDVARDDAARDGAVPAPLSAAPAAAVEPSPTAPTVMDVMIDVLRGQGGTPHQVWLPPLDTAPAVSMLLPPLGVDPDRGLGPVGWSGNGRLVVPVGVVDKPSEQRQDLLVASLADAAGHVAVAGGPRSGKSTLVRTFVTSLALTHTPREVQVYCLDFSGGALAGLADLPHVGGVAGRLETERCSRLVAEVSSLLDERERLFVQHRIDSVATFRRRRAAGERFGERDHGDVFLVVDGWSVLKDDFDRLYEQVAAIASRGLTYGVHLVVTTSRWMDIRPAVKDMLGTRFELRLGDPIDSELGRRVAMKVPEGSPGRGITKDGLHFLTAVPRVDDVAGAEGMSEAAGAGAGAIREAWPADPAPPVRLLPRRVELTELEDAVARRGVEPTPTRLAVGLSERDLGPAVLDFSADSHLLVYGDTESGKTAALRLLARRLTAACTPQEARMVVVDYRRSLLAEVDDEHLFAYVTSAEAAAEHAERIAVTLRQRMPPDDVTPQQLRERSWWSGPELYLVVDDYDLVASGGSPLEPIVPLVPHARDVGLHVVLARRSAGASRGLYDPLVQRVTEVGAAGLLLSGDPAEGAVFAGMKMTPQPPGRGVLLRRSPGSGLLQLAWDPPRS
ncbi:MAG: type VII secretion protein EccCa [Dermatophilaceae bacterium]